MQQQSQFIKKSQMFHIFRDRMIDLREEQTQK